MLALGRSRSPLTTLALAVALAACGDDSTGPELDPVQTNDAVQDVQNLVATNAAVLSLIPIIVSPAIVSVHELRLDDPAGLVRALRARMQGALAESKGSSFVLLEVIPPELFGRTYEYNPDSAGYVHNPERGGAPSNGVRFILYQTDAFGSLVFPLDEIGQVDFVEESTTGQDRVHIVAVVEGVTALDYRITDSSTSTGTVAAAGFISDGTTRINFNGGLTFSGTATEGEFVFSLNVQVPSLGIAVSLSGTERFTTETDVLTFTFSVTTNEGSASLSLTITDFIQLSGEFRTGGRTIIEIGGNAGAPTFERPDGSQPSAEEIDGMLSLVGASLGFLIFLDLMLAPLFVFLFL